MPAISHQPRRCEGAAYPAGAPVKRTSSFSSRADAGCPCGSEDSYPDCCGAVHGGKPAPTAEKLMRARYSAYALRDDAFILASWHPTTRPPLLDDDAGQAETRWLGLEVVHSDESGDDATVEFIARYKRGGRARRLHEVSRFVREAGAWYYLDGSFPKEKETT